MLPLVSSFTPEPVGKRPAKDICKTSELLYSPQQSSDGLLVPGRDLTGILSSFASPRANWCCNAEC